MMNCTIRNYVLTDHAGCRYRLFSDQFVHLDRCLEFMRLVIDGNIRVNQTRRCGGRNVEVSKDLDKHRDWLDGYSRLFNRQYTFHPYVRHFLLMYRDHAIHVTGGRVAGMFEDFLLAMRTEAKISRLKKRAADWQGKFTRNADRLVELMAYVSRRAEHLTEIELELDYLASRFTRAELKSVADTADEVLATEAVAYWNGSLLDCTEPARARVPFIDVQRDRKRLLANLKGKPTLFKHLQGYVWRVRFTPAAGYSLRLSLIFDGAQGIHSGLGQEIGDYWATAITRGRGCFRELKPWPAIETARRIAALAGNAKIERQKLRRELMDHLGGPLLAAQVLPQPGCNVFGTGQVHRPALLPSLHRSRAAEPTRVARGAAHIQNPHSLGTTATYPSSTIEGLAVVGEPVAARQGGQTASRVIAGSA